MTRENQYYYLSSMVYFSFRHWKTKQNNNSKQNNNFNKKKKKKQQKKKNRLRSTKANILTLKTPRKPASENAVCLCLLLNILANFSNIFLPRGAVWSWSTMFAKMFFCVFFNHKQMTKQMPIVVTGSLRVKTKLTLGSATMVATLPGWKIEVNE